MLKQIHTFILKYYNYIIVTSLLLSIFSIYLTKDLVFQTSFADLLPQSSDSVKDLKSVTKKQLSKK